MKKLIGGMISQYDDVQKRIAEVLQTYYGGVRVNHALDDDNRYYSMVTGHNKIEAFANTGEVFVYFIDAEDQKFDVAYLENLISAAADIKKILPL